MCKVDFFCRKDYQNYLYQFRERRDLEDIDGIVSKSIQANSRTILRNDLLGEKDVLK